MNKIYVVRHGETDWNKNGICQGKTNISLNENGIAQAKVLKDKINVNLIDICYVSPLNRTIETAKIITNKPSITNSQLDFISSNNCFIFSPIL